MRSSALIGLLAFALLTAGCGPRAFRSPLEPLDRAAEAARDGSKRAETLALAAWHAWLVRGDGAAAQALVERSLDDERSPWALLLLAELGARAADPAGEAEPLLELVESGEAPFDALAARRLGRLVGISRALDQRLTERFEALLARGRRGEVAAELRAHLLEIATYRDPDRALELAREAGRVPSFALVGPLSRYAHLEFDRARPHFELGPIEDDLDRVLRTPTGVLELRELPRYGDVYYALAVVEAPRRGIFRLRAKSDRGTSVSIFLDGVEVLARRGFGGPQPTELTAEVELDAGEHLLAIRLGRGRGAGKLEVELAAADGSPSPLEFRPAVRGDAAARRRPRLLREPPSFGRVLADRLAPEVGVLGGWLGADVALDSDPETAQLLIESLAPTLADSPAFKWLEARGALVDPSLPPQEREDRAATALGFATRDEGNVAARVALAAHHRREGRWADAERLLAAGSESLALDLERVRLARDRGFDGLYWKEAQALAAQHGDRCDVLELAHGAAWRKRDVEGRKAHLEALQACPDGWRRVLQAERAAGAFDEARRIAERYARLAPDAPEMATLRAEIEQAAGRPGEAAEILARFETTWPELARLPRLRAQYLVAAGKEDLAREARLRALEIDGSDLGLLRAEAFERRKAILAERDPDAMEAIRAFEASRASYDAPAVILVDFVGIQVNPDGSQIERTHFLAKILDKRGIELLGEARIPDEAEILELRTIKADGSILEPEPIEAKDSISFPGLEVGDYVEYQYLRARGRRDAALPGWATPRFFFAARDLPIVDSLFVVRAEKSLGLEVDAHQHPPPGQLVDEGTHLAYVARGRDLPAFVPESRAVSAQEIVPWVQVGSGAGERELACLLADRLLGATWIDRGVERWVRETVRGATTPTEQIERIWERLMEEIEGGGSFETRASHVLARGRGNRAVLLKAALDVLGIENAWVVLRPFDRDPHPHRFPDSTRLQKFVLVARPDPAGGWLWLDPSVRHAPLGSVAPEGRGVQGFVLRSGEGESACVPTTSPVAAEDGRVLVYRLEVQDDGTIEGEAVERFRGFDAASARHALERLDADRLHQVVETSLAREFSGAELLGAEVEFGEEVALRYAFRLDSGLEPRGEDRFVLDLAFLRLYLAERYLTGAQRKSPLLLGREESLVVEAEILLPPGLRLVASPSATLENSDYGSFRRSVGGKNESLVIRDVLELRRGRILPHEYPGFAAWLSAIDQSQMDGLLLERAASGEEAEGDLGVEVEAEVGAGDPAPLPAE